MTELKIEVENKGDIRIIHLNGFLDVHTYLPLRDIVRDLINKNYCKIIMDMDELEYIGSSGLEVIIGNIQDARKSGGDIKLCFLKEKVFKVFDLLGLPKFFDISDSLEEAISRFNNNVSAN